MQTQEQLRLEQQAAQEQAAAEQNQAQTNLDTIQADLDATANDSAGADVDALNSAL